MTDTPSIAVGGENLIDHVTRDGEVSAFPGGSPFNVALALGRQGADAHYLSPISDDRWGDLLAETLAGAGVVLAGGRRPEPTTMARVTVAGGAPSYRFEREGTAERAVTEASLRAALPAGCRAVHTGSLALTGGPDADAWEAFCAAAHGDGLAVSLDPNVRLSVIADPGAWRARVLRMLGKVHLLKLSDEDLEGLLPGAPGEEALRTVRAATPARVVVLTRGAGGAAAWIGDDEIAVPAAPVPDLADTVGAGDTFTATMLAELGARGALEPGGLGRLGADALAATLRRASVAAALNCARAGCDPPTREELDAAMAGAG